MILPPAAAVRLSGPNGHSQLHVELAALKTELRKRYDFAAWIAVTPAMRRVSTQMEIARSTDCVVLFIGERGSARSTPPGRSITRGRTASRPLCRSTRRLLGAEELGNLIRRFFVTEERPAHPDRPAGDAVPAERRKAAAGAPAVPGRAVPERSPERRAAAVRLEPARRISMSTASRSWRSSGPRHAGRHPDPASAAAAGGVVAPRSTAAGGREPADRLPDDRLHAGSSS